MKYNLALSNKFTQKWIKRKKNLYRYTEANNQISIIDLFSGCGGLSLGAIEAIKGNGFTPKISLSIDNNEAAHQVYCSNFKEYIVSAINADINDYFKYRNGKSASEKEILLKEKTGDIDILVAGPPCQGHSDLNNITRRNDPRNELYLSVLQAVKLFKPHFVLIENVPTVIHSKNEVVQKTRDTLISLDYSIKELVINFIHLGVPQTRKRHVLIASKGNEFTENIVSIKSETSIPILFDYISDLEDSISDKNTLYKTSKASRENLARMEYLFKKQMFDLPNDLRPSCHKEKKHSYNSCYGRLSYNKPAQTITSGFGSIGQGRFIHPTKMRTITPKEAARIQGFPDYFKFEGINLTELRKMIANAVPPQLTYSIIDNYMGYLLSEKLNSENIVESV